MGTNHVEPELYIRISDLLVTLMQIPVGMATEKKNLLDFSVLVTHKY